MKVKIENSWKHELKKIFDSRFFYTITKAIKKGFFRDHDDALEYVLNKKNLSDPLEQLRDKTISQDDFLEIVEKTQKSL